MMFMIEYDNKLINKSMKTSKFFAAAMVLAMTVACGPKGGNAANGAQADSLGISQPVKPASPKDTKFSKAEIDSVSYLLGINFGSFLKGYNFGEDINYAQMKRGISDFVNAKGNQNDPEFVKQFKIDPNEMNRIFNDYLAKRQNMVLAENKVKEGKFLAQNRKNAGVVVTETGLQYKIIEEGGLKASSARDTVVVRYRGTLPDGSVFDETPEGAEPVRMQLNRVIAGWTEGLQLVGEGGKINLVIPSELAYGTNGTRGIEPNTPLTFDVEVIEVHPYVEPVTEE